MTHRGMQRAVQVLSLCVFVFLYGFFAGAIGWFPGTQVRRALVQAGALTRGPNYLTPKVFDRQGALTVDASRVQPGLTLISSVWKASDHWSPALRLIDQQGEVLHQWLIDPTELFPGMGGARTLRTSEIYVHGFHLFPNGDILANVDHAGTVRLDGCGGVLWSLPMRNHHSITEADDGTFWIPISSLEETPASAEFPKGYPGLGSHIYDDRIVHITGDGKVLGEISVLDLLYSNGLQRYVVKGRETLPGDILHLNDVEALPRELAPAYPLFEPGDLLISIRNLDLVLVADPRTKKVKWHASDPFNQQHDPDYIGGGWIGVFDNNRDGTARGAMLGGSRIVAVQPHTDSVKVLFPRASSESFYTAIMGKWQTLPNGNLLLTESEAGRILEVAPDGKTVWEWIHDPYDESRTIEVTEGTRYSLSVEQIATWPCSDARALNNRLEGIQ